LFEWDDTVAAEKHRQEQARQLVRAVVVRTETTNREPITVRAYVSLPSNDVQRYAYVRTDMVFQKKELREIVLRRALRELENWERRYRDLMEFADLLAAIKEAKKLIAV
jgi:hypothetical protein